jgi:signal transduction histidine kinase
MMLPLAEQKGLKMSVAVDKGAGAIQFDKDRIEQVLINLLSNAIKFTEKGGVAVSAIMEDGGVHVLVKDSGRGIRAEDMPRLFSSFEQLEDIDERQEGTGLGLAISKEIVELHGGKIWVESEFGKGTVVHFTLPVIDKHNVML